MANHVKSNRCLTCGRQSTSKKMVCALKKLKRMPPHHRREAMRVSSDNFIHELCGQVKMLRNATLPHPLKKKIKKKRKELQKFVHPETTTETKRKMLRQRGGFLPLLLAALPAVGAMFGNLIRGARRR